MSVLEVKGFDRTGWDGKSVDAVNGASMSGQVSTVYQNLKGVATYVRDEHWRMGLALQPTLTHIRYGLCRRRYRPRIPHRLIRADCGV